VSLATSLSVPHPRVYNADLPELTLDAVGVSTTEQLTLPPRHQLKNLPIPSHELDELVAHCLQLTGPQAISGDRLAEQQGKTRSIWQGWGTDGVDELFKLEEGGVIEIAGAKRVGRSVCVSAFLVYRH
jgi:hypothetical protein